MYTLMENLAFLEEVPTVLPLTEYRQKDHVQPSLPLGSGLYQSSVEEGRSLRPFV